MHPRRYRRSHPLDIEWFMQQIEEAKKEKVETYTASAGNEVTSFISMTLLGISSVYVNHEEKLKMKFEDEIASAEEIPVTVSFLRNEQAEKLWQGREDFERDDKSLRKYLRREDR
ncbi:hypothetical protein GUITHDRAFT_119545 [Guillardia theta CCMP2712]|uniref:Uncharacterized protein n=1 Tax=Guillardia theta (strain CCMP2712) TaxID=905079 RepID=L1IDC3_GUITC|nr:hypothetical protein GUITHDRAFT_119545 [Guillardia theta CCMP2712]EKX34251.1 hypothetical protein GUITHDRAFT_119545 [Guillardia theta CCMP2712]|eukprot:XP_005821231.1 hypothetical protein GUITHDRAFT_119545 [Guillardia theta CCMP2712]